MRVLFRASMILALATLLSCSSPDSGGSTNEGSKSSPIQLTVGTSRACKVGTLKDNALDSFYQFTTAATAGTNSYTVTISNVSPASVTQFVLQLYELGFDISASSPSFTTTLTKVLTPGHAYGLDITNLYADTQNVTFNLLITGPN